MSKVTFGAYYNTNSIIHRLDPRIKIIGTLLLMIGIFFIPMEAYYLFVILGLILLFLIILSKVPVIKFLNGIKQIIYILLFSLLFQIIFNQSGTIVETYSINISIGTIALIILIYAVYQILKKFIKYKMILSLIFIIFLIVMLRYSFIDNSIWSYDIGIYSEGLYTGIYILVRVLLLVLLSSLLTLTTKPIDLNYGIEALLSPLEKLKIKTSIFAMMLSISLRFIPTLFMETEKILKAQASRGVDFKEGKLKDKIKQIISLLVPMFVVSFKRAEELSNAMEVRGYIPGAKRTKLNILKIQMVDIIALILVIILFLGCLTINVLLKVGVL